MTKTLSERLDEACARVLIAEATGNLKIMTRAVNNLLVEAYIAAALARRVEGANERTVVQDREGFLYVGAMAAGVQFGERVALVPVEGGA